MLKPVPRRTMLRGAGVAVALPILECMSSRSVPAAQAEFAHPRRMIAINFELSLHPPNVIPAETGRDYALPVYLKPMADLRDEFTVISGTSHPDVDGGHAASKSWLTGAPHPGAANFRNSISIDQFAAKHIGLQTRLSSMSLGSGGLSVTSNGVTIPGSSLPSRVFRRMFIEGRPHEKAARIEALKEGQSILDAVRENAKRMQRRVSRRDGQKLDEYFTAVRDAELQLRKAEQWQHRPKPRVDEKPPQDIRDQTRAIERAKSLYRIMFLAIQTDSTRLITYAIGDSSHVPSLPGVSMNYHDLSHHGKDPEKLRQLAIVESEHFKAFADFVRRLHETSEGDSSLLDQTMVMVGSHMHSGNHNNRNLPIILAGGGFEHGQHLAFDQHNNYPLANLYITMLRRLGIDIDQFASSTGPMRGLDLRPGV